ncbi:hypothetical protein [Nonomuraea candida]|uniref:hypothetical protein n=1 Tax=Nonomuraea candida TaxID=359159 RepID=UPI000A867863|nr:hypothetical protein [Nonomuraea candida]
MNDRKTPPPPKGSGRSGRKLWNSIMNDLDLDAHEELLLLQAVRCVDRLDLIAEELQNAPQTVENSKGDLVTHPLIVEQRQQSLTLARLQASLRLPSGLVEGGDDLNRPQRRGAARGSYGVRGVVA